MCILAVTLFALEYPQVGKSNAIAACARALGYDVLEINASSIRSGRHISAMFGEASQSHRIHAGAAPLGTSVKPAARYSESSSAYAKP